VSEVSNFDVEQAVTELRQALVDIHTCLEEYRHHEGRELLVHEMKSQLDVIKNLERDLARFKFPLFRKCWHNFHFAFSDYFSIVAI